jgi:mRNA interferase YafQ
VLTNKFVTKFKKDVKKYQYQTLVLDELDKVIKLLLAEEKLPGKYRDHSLVGDYFGMRECHVGPDVLLVYSIDEKRKILYLERIGSHSELF